MEGEPEKVKFNTETSPESLELKTLRNRAIMAVGVKEFEKAIDDFSSRLEAKYPMYSPSSLVSSAFEKATMLHPNVNDFAAWYILVDSSRVGAEYFDFPGEDSVKDFFERLVKESSI